MCATVVLPILLSMDGIRHGAMFLRDNVGYALYAESPETEVFSGYLGLL